MAAEQEGRDPVQAVAEVQLPPDPNAEVVAALDPARAEAHADAFWGTGERVGCYPATDAQVWGVSVDDLLSNAAERLESAERAIEADPRISSARDDHVECIRSAGYEVDPLEDIFLYLNDRAAEIADELYGPSGGNGLPVDHPLVVEYLELSEAFNERNSACESDYLEVVAPIENEYLGHNG